MKKGLCSVTFRTKTVAKIISLSAKQGLDCIEWGGDIHVPCGKTARAEKVGAATVKAGLGVYSYGSYFRCDDLDKFERTSDTAYALGAKIIRVWAGTKDAEKCSEEDFLRLTETLRRCCDFAQKRGQTVACEFHGGTYNNGRENALRLIKSVDRKNFKTYWQPIYWKKFVSDEERVRDNIDTIVALSPYIACVHAYQMRGRKRLSLASGKSE